MSASVRKSAVHIDTSLQIELCKDPESVRVVERALSEFTFHSTSTYTRLEFKRAWLRDLAYLHRISRDVRSFDQILTEMNKRLGAHSGNARRLNRCLQGIASFLSRVPDETSFGVMLVRFRCHLEQTVLGAFEWWERPLTHVFTGTQCVRANEKPSLAGGKLDVTIPRCKRERIACAVHTFFEEEKDKFLSIAAAIEGAGASASTELKTIHKTIRIAERDPEHLCNDRHCSQMADALIAVDSGFVGTFAANNDREWELLAKTLGRELINPVHAART